MDPISQLIDLFVEVTSSTSHTNRIAALNREVDQLKQQARRSSNSDPVRAELDELRASNGELRLYVAVLVRLLQQKGIIDREDLARVIEQTDDEDGERDRAHSGGISG